MSNDLAAEAKKVFFDDRSLIHRNYKSGRITDSSDRRRMMTYPFQFGYDRTKDLRPRRNLDVLDRLHRATERHPVCKRGGTGESFGQKQRAVHSLAFDELLDATILVKQTWDRANDVFAHRFEKKCADSAKSEKTGPTGIAKAPGPSLPSAVATLGPTPAVYTVFCVKAQPHRIYPLGPIFVQNEFSQARMALEHEPEQIFHFALVPIDRRSIS